MWLPAFAGSAQSFLGYGRTGVMRSFLGSWVLLASLALAPIVAAGDQELVSFEIVGAEIPKPLTDTPGDPVIGRAIVTDATNATCLICHAMPIPEQPDHGNLAPDLTGVGSRYTAAELRLRLVNSKIVNPDTIMPSYYRTDGFLRVSTDYQGKTIYSAQDIEDAIAYLMTLRDG